MKKRPKKEEQSPSTESKVELKASETKPEIMTFETFFAKCVRIGKLKKWQHDEVAAFFKDHRLKAKEDPEVFEETLKRY